MSEKLYKYRDLKNFRRFVDIILKNRLYASKYNKMNDPMEGHYFYWNGTLDTSVIEKLKSEKEKLRICSLSLDSQNELMWNLYANKHRGVVIEVEIENTYCIESINYEDDLLTISNSNFASLPAKKILTIKYKSWEYEKEKRVFIEGGSMYVDVNITRVITGKSMSDIDYGFVKLLIEKINSNICVIREEDQ